MAANNDVNSRRLTPPVAGHVDGPASGSSAPLSGFSACASAAGFSNPTISHLACAHLEHTSAGFSAEGTLPKQTADFDGTTLPQQALRNSSDAGSMHYEGVVAAGSPARVVAEAFKEQDQPRDMRASAFVAPARHYQPAEQGSSAAHHRVDPPEKTSPASAVTASGYIPLPEYGLHFAPEHYTSNRSPPQPAAPPPVSSSRGLDTAPHAPSIVTDTAAQRVERPPSPDPLESCLNMYMGNVPDDGPGATTESVSAINARSLKEAATAARDVDGTGELSYYVEEYGGHLLHLLPGSMHGPLLLQFVEHAPRALRYLPDLPKYVHTCVTAIQCAPLGEREQRAFEAPLRIADGAATRSAALQAASQRGMGSGPPVLATPTSRDDFSAAYSRGQQAEQEYRLEEARRQAKEEGVRLELQAAQLKAEADRLERARAGRPSVCSPCAPSAYLVGGGVSPGHQPLPAGSMSPPEVPYMGSVGAAGVTPQPPPTDDVTTMGKGSTRPMAVPASPTFYTDVLGEARPQSHIKLRKAAAVFASCSFDKASLKSAALKKDDLTKLINVAFEDYDSWLPSRPEVLERLLKLYYQHFYIASMGASHASEAAAGAALEVCRDLLRDSIAESPNLERVYKRTKKSRTDDPGKDILFMIHCIDAHAVPASSASIAVDIEKRRPQLGTESIATFFEELMNMCAGHLDAAAVRTRFIVGVTLAMDEAEQSMVYNPMLIDAVRDIVADVNLPSSNDELREKLGRTSATSRIWQRSVSASGSMRGAKEARTHVQWPQEPQQQQSSPPPASPPQSAPPQPAPSPQPPVYEFSQHSITRQAPPAVAFSAAPQAYDPISASTFYGAAGYQQQAGYGGQGYGGQQYGGRGYGGGRSYGGDYGKGGRGHKGGKGDGGKGGKGMDKDPAAPTKFYDMPAIIATGLIWPATTKLHWSNPARTGATGTGDGLYGLDCPLCGTGKKRAFTWDEYGAHFGAPPGMGMGKHPQPADVVVYHRGLKCKEGEWAVQAYVRDHADAPECMKSYMTEGALAAFKSQVVTEGAAESAA